MGLREAVPFNRYYIPGLVWHITHRCHRREFLLKFARERRRWQHWLFEARKRYGLIILNFAVTSNHIHLLAEESREGVVSKSLQLVSGRVAQEYNLRKGRRGAFWEDRYHATAIDGGLHLRRCMAYIDLNMVRAGAVNHPGEWTGSGYREIQRPPQRYRIIDTERTAELLGLRDAGDLAAEQNRWVQEALSEEESILLQRQDVWTESLAVGSDSFADKMARMLGVRSRFRDVDQYSGSCVLREKGIAYNADFDGKMGTLRPYMGSNNA